MKNCTVVLIPGMILVLLLVAQDLLSFFGIDQGGGGGGCVSNLPQSHSRAYPQPTSKILGASAARGQACQLLSISRGSSHAVKVTHISMPLYLLYLLNSSFSADGSESTRGEICMPEASSPRVISVSRLFGWFVGNSCRSLEPSKVVKFTRTFACIRYVVSPTRTARADLSDLTDGTVTVDDTTESIT